MAPDKKKIYIVSASALAVLLLALFAPVGMGRPLAAVLLLPTAATACVVIKKRTALSLNAPTVLLIMGVPILTMELSVGRASRGGIVSGYRTLEKPRHKWHLHGWVCVLGNYLLMFYYTTVAGWMLNYFIKYVKGDFSGIDFRESLAEFGSITENDRIFCTGTFLYNRDFSSG